MLNYSIRGPLAPSHITWVLWLDWQRGGRLTVPTKLTCMTQGIISASRACDS
jgi:hypothetical protein